MAQSLAPLCRLALGVTFVIATGRHRLSIGTVCIASSVGAGHMFERNLIPLRAVIPLMIAMGALFGLVNGILVAKLKVPAFIATLGTMMLSRGLSAIIVAVPNIFYPTGSWFNKVFSKLQQVSRRTDLGIRLRCFCACILCIKTVSAVYPGNRQQRGGYPPVRYKHG